jgi:hypothetical protein
VGDGRLMRLAAHQAWCRTYADGEFQGPSARSTCFTRGPYERPGSAPTPHMPLTKLWTDGSEHPNLPSQRLDVSEQDEERRETHPNFDHNHLHTRVDTYVQSYCSPRHRPGSLCLQSQVEGVRKLLPSTSSIRVTTPCNPTRSRVHVSIRSPLHVSVRMGLWGGRLAAASSHGGVPLGSPGEVGRRWEERSIHPQPRG